MPEEVKEKLLHDLFRAERILGRLKSYFYGPDREVWLEIGEKLLGGEWEEAESEAETLLSSAKSQPEIHPETPVLEKGPEVQEELVSPQPIFVLPEDRTEARDGEEVLSEPVMDVLKRDIYVKSPVAWRERAERAQKFITISGEVTKERYRDASSRCQRFEVGLYRIGRPISEHDAFKMLRKYQNRKNQWYAGRLEQLLTTVSEGVIERPDYPIIVSGSITADVSKAEQRVLCFDKNTLYSVPRSIMFSGNCRFLVVRPRS